VWEYIYDKLLFKKTLKVESRGLPLFVKTYRGEECKDCQLCIDLCPEEALSVMQEKLTLDLMKCSACEYCLTVCSKEYLTSRPYEEVVISKDNRFKVVEPVGAKSENEELLGPQNS
jgi:ferredoxin